MSRGFSFSKLAFRYEFNAKMRRRFYIKLAQLLENGVSLGPALAQLQLLSGKSKRSTMPRLYQRWRREIENGKNFGQCVAPYVPGTEAILLETGSDSGHLVDALRNAAETSEQQARVRNAILSNAAYPALLMCMLLAALYMMAFTVIPTFAQILPVEEWQGISYKVAKVSIFIQSYGIVLLTIFGVIMGGVLFSLPRWTSRSRLAVEGILPWSLYRIWQGSSFLLSVAALMNAGVKMDEVSLGKLGKNADPYLAQRIKAIRRGIVSGANLGDALHQTGLVFPDREIIADLRIYAQLRGFDKNLVRITRTWVEELVDKVGGIMKVLNTVVLFLIAIVIGCLVAALYGVVQQIQAQA